MKHVIRNGVWETNSSAVHSLTFKNDLEPSKLAKMGGYTYAHFGKFGKDFEEYFDQQSKLNYLVSYLFYLSGWSVERTYDSYEFKNLEEVVCEHAGTIGLKIAKNPSKPEIDHQAQPSDCGCSFLSWDEFYDKEFLRNFIFNPNVGFRTGCD